MKTSWKVDGNVWRLFLQLHPEDPVTGHGQGNLPVSLLALETTIKLPHAVSEPHPDLEALATLVIIRPWIARRLILRRAVTKQFADLVQKLFRIEVGPVDDALIPRTAGRTPLLAYSAGFDSAAASILLPADTPHIHHRRTPHPRIPNRATHWRADAIEHLAIKAGERGRDLHIVRADFEYLVHPFPSLPHWFGFAVGPLLMADDLGGGAVAMGGTLETFYMDMGRKWTGERPNARGMDDLPAMMGMPVMRPVLGITEIGTMQLTLGSDLADAARSCTGGTFSAPCGVCGKCIRKDMVTATTTGGIPKSLASLSAEALAAAKMTADPPLYMQAQLEYALARLNLDDLALTELRDKLDPSIEETAWMERAYRPAVERGIPEPWRASVAAEIESRIGWMSESDVAVAEAWDREIEHVV